MRKLTDPALATASFLTISRPHPASAGVFVLHLLDTDLRLLLEVEWRPGEAFSVRRQPLAGSVPRDCVSASIAGRFLAVANSAGAIRLIDRFAGTVQAPPGMTGPAVIVPSGARLVVARDCGLLTMGVWGSDETAPPFLSGIEPLLVDVLDSPRCAMPVTTGAGPARFAIGCYGRVAIVDVERLDSRDWVARCAMLDVPLAYDPVFFAWPPPIAPVSPRHHLFVRDQFGTGLAAIDLASLEIVRAELGTAAYGHVRHAVPALDGGAALVLMGDATARLWRPGEAPRAVVLPAGGWPILWYAGRLVLQDAERGRLLEVDWRP
jgi:hypothetical protein